MTAKRSTSSRLRHGRCAPAAAHLLAVIAACAGCSSDDAGGSEAGHDGHTAGTSGAGASAAAGAGGAAGADAARSLFGGFDVDVVPADEETTAHTAFLGKLFDGPVPPPIALEQDSAQGDCRLLVPYVPFCDPDCGQDVCTADGECTPYPAPQSVGTVHVHGLGDDELVLDPVGSQLAYMPAASLPYPPCAAGDRVHVQTDAFELEAPCIEPLALAADDTIVVRSGQPVQVAWTAGAEVEGARVRIVLDIAHHGGQKGEIDCEVEDSGAFEIPEPLVTELVSLGLAGFPTIVVSRVSIATAENRPEVSLAITSEVDRIVDTGVISCGMAGESCPDGMTCRMTDLICVE